MKKLFIFLVFFISTNTAFTADVTIEMLNKLDDRNMVFSSEIVKVDVGDTVSWVSTCLLYTSDAADE